MFYKLKNRVYCRRVQDSCNMVIQGWKQHFAWDWNFFIKRFAVRLGPAFQDYKFNLLATILEPQGPSLYTLS